MLKLGFDPLEVMLTLPLAAPLATELFLPGEGLLLLPEVARPHQHARSARLRIEGEERHLVALRLALEVGDELAARREGASVKAAWAPPGYDATDLHILEWITAHRRSRRAQAKTILAA